MKVLLQEGRLNKPGALLFIKIQLKPYTMSNNLQLTPGSYKAAIIFTTCLLLVIQIFK